MISIDIIGKTKTRTEMAIALRDIANRIENGSIVGVCPTYLLTGTEEPSTENKK